MSYNKLKIKMNELNKAIIDIIEDKKGENISLIDLTKEGGTICDYFIVCEAQSTTQVNAICNEIEDKMIELHGEKSLRIQGRDNNLWIVMDYGDVFVHIFERETREFYKLDELWSNVPVTKIETQQ